MEPPQHERPDHRIFRCTVWVTCQSFAPWPEHSGADARPRIPKRPDSSVDPGRFCRCKVQVLRGNGYGDLSLGAAGLRALPGRHEHRCYDLTGHVGRDDMHLPPRNSHWSAVSGIRATRPDRKLPIAARVTRVALPSENRPEQKARTLRRMISILSFCHRCCRMWQPSRSPVALLRQPSCRPLTPAPHVTGAWKKHQARTAADRETTTAGPAALLIHAAINSAPATTPHHCPNPPSRLLPAPEVAMSQIVASQLGTYAPRGVLDRIGSQEG